MKRPAPLYFLRQENYAARVYMSWQDVKKWNFFVAVVVVFGHSGLISFPVNLF